MTSLLERTISIIAPHRCFSCGKESNVLCVSCGASIFDEQPDVCYLCNKPTFDSRPCKACEKQTDIEHVWMTASYEGVVKRLIRAYKFERVRAAYTPLAAAMLEVLPYLDESVIVVPIPTASNHVRQRGYDHARLLAKEIARQRGWRRADALKRRHNLRQVGASRVQRRRQAEGAYALRLRRDELEGAHILLVDDVTTSGATLTVAAQILKQAGAAHIDAVVVAKHTLE
jgi:ComF family protein